MTTTNGFDVAATPPTADVNFSDGVSTYGFLLKSPLDEIRGDSFTAGVSSGSPTYRDAEPFSHMEWKAWGGGFGQVEQDSATGGTGQGGDPTKWFDSNAFTMKQFLMPGLARNLLFPSASVSPIPAATAALETVEIPRGVLPYKNIFGQSPVTPNFNATTAGAVVISMLRILVKFEDPTALNVLLNVTLNNITAATSATFITTLATVDGYTNFKWVTLTTSNPITINNNNQCKITVNGAGSTLNVVYGCWVGQIVGGSPSPVYPFRPWVQLCIPGASGDSYKMWTGSPRRFEVVDNAGTKNVMAVTDTTLINATDTTRTERALGGQMTWSMVYNNQLLVGVQGVGTIVYTAAQCGTLAAGATNAGGIMGPACVHKGKVYCVDGTAATGGRKIQSFDGNAGAFTDVIANDKIGKASSNQKNNINNIFIQFGRLYVLKSEGLFEVYDDIDTVTTTTEPTINQLIPFDQWEHTDNGKFLVYMMGSWFFNVRNQIWQLNFAEGSIAISVLIPPFPMGRYTTNNYVSGLTSDGQVLLASYNNVGVIAFNGQGWHNITEFYEQNTADGKASGLRYILNTTGGLGPDNIYVGDGRYLVQLPFPSLTSPVSTQLYLKDQNRCFYWISSEWNGDLAEIQKTMHSVVLKASMSGQSGVGGWDGLKLVAAIWQSGGPNYRTIIDQTLDEGLQRDIWTSPSTLTPPQNINISTHLLDVNGHLTTTVAPGVWFNFDFNNASFSAEKLVSDNEITHPVQIVNASFILYGWKGSDGSQYVTQNLVLPDITHSTASADPVYINAVVLKYLPIQKYLARYAGFDIDLARMLLGFGGNKPTIAQLNAAMLWLRGRMGATTFTQAQILNFTNTLKTVTGIFQNHRARAQLPTLLSYEKLPNAESVQFDFQGMVSETLP